MRIALFTNGFWPLSIGGMQKHSYYLANYLLQNDVSVDIFVPISGNNQISQLEESYGAFTNLVRFIPVDVPSKFNFPGHYIYESYLYSIKVYEQFLKSKSKFDLVYIQGFTGWKTLLEFRKNNDSTPTILNFHGLEMFQSSATLRQFLIKLFFRPFVISNLKISKYNQSLGGKLNNIIARYSKNEKSIYEQGIGIGKDWLNLSSKSKDTARKLVFIGRYERRKGVEELTTVLKELHSLLDFEFHFIGPIPSKYHINSTKNIIYHGEIKSSSRIKDILRDSDVLVCPSYSEGMPTVILEAMASCNAIIATNVGAISKLVSFKNGWLINPKEINSLKTAIKESILVDLDILKSKQTESYNIVKNNYLWDKVITDMIYKFNDIINKKI